MFKIFATQISDEINLDSFRVQYSAELLYSNYYELFYEVDTEIYVSIFKYGVVCFFNFDDARMDEFIKLISGHCIYFYDCELNKNFLIEPDSQELKFGFNKMKIVYYDIDAIKLIMLNIAQAVALENYFQLARIQLKKTSKFTTLLEKNGKLSITDKELKKFIGKTHNLKNQIVENLSLLDSISDIEHNEYLIIIDEGMKDALYIEKRAKNIYDELTIIREHLEYFNDIIKHKSSTKLEWIVIALLIIFVIDIVIERFF